MDNILDRIDMGEESALFDLMSMLKECYPVETARIANHIQNMTNVSRTAVNKAIRYKYECFESCNDMTVKQYDSVIYFQDLIQRIDSVMIWIPVQCEHIPMPVAYMESLVELDLGNVDVDEQERLLEQIKNLHLE